MTPATNAAESTANLHTLPDAPPFSGLRARSLVARLMTDAGGWSLIAAPSGIGFKPASQLQEEP